MNPSAESADRDTLVGLRPFRGKLAVVTGAGSGMGRELVRLLAAAGSRVAACDVRPGSVETAASWSAAVTGHVCDVSDEAQVRRFRDEVLEQHGTDHVDLVFNNAGIGGGGSLFTDSRESWERTFAVNFWGVYFCTRTFLPLLVKSDEGVLVNTSSVNGFWASLGPGMPNTAYSTAKFAVKGFTESLIEDLRVNAPNVRVVLVMPGHIGTDIVRNSQWVHSEAGDVEKLADRFRDSAPLTAADAATVIINGVLAGHWRILVGEDAIQIDEAVRADPDAAYDHTGVGMLTLPGAGSISARPVKVKGPGAGE
jgi:NAD(P)-dependent dehydrogenase (short-subunit alcohol dehydrogenase family)